MQVRIKTAHGYLSFQPPPTGQPGPVMLEYRAVPAEWETFELEGLVLPPTPPSPTPAPTPAGDLTADTAKQIVFATASKFPQLIQTFPTDQLASDAATELLLRTIWHLQQSGFQAARQRNPSKAISGDKLCVLLADQQWHIYDIFSLGYANRATTVQFVELTGADPVADSGIPD